MSKIHGKGKNAWLQLYTHGDLEIDVAAEGHCDKCGAGGVVTFDVTYPHGSIELCFPCIEKGKEEIALHLLKEFGKDE